MTKHHLQKTVGELIALLQEAPQSATLQFCTGLYPGSFYSYRGYYEDLAISITTYPTTVAVWLALLKSQIGQTTTGYKGGEYKTTERTALWVADYSDTGPAIVGIQINRNAVKIMLAHID